jgi:hypothetical protein
MRKTYVLEISEKVMMQASDMLRYDGVYEIRCDKSVGLCKLDAVGFTPARWRGFGVPEPRVVAFFNVTDKEWEHKAAVSTGFVEGLRFCQGRLVREEFKKHDGIMLVENPNPSGV